MDVQPFSYLSYDVPEGYACAKCGANNVKLWRGYCSLPIDLVCVNCACEEEGIDPSSVDKNGSRRRKESPFETTYQIGIGVPAIPDEDGIGYWGLTSIPSKGIEWWIRLSTHAGDLALLNVIGKFPSEIKKNFVDNLQKLLLSKHVPSTIIVDIVKSSIVTSLLEAIDEVQHYRLMTSPHTCIEVGSDVRFRVDTTMAIKKVKDQYLNVFRFLLHPVVPGTCA